MICRYCKFYIYIFFLIELLTYTEGKDNSRLFYYCFIFYGECIKFVMLRFGSWDLLVLVICCASLTVTIVFSIIYYNLFRFIEILFK